MIATANPPPSATSQQANPLGLDLLTESPISLDAVAAAIPDSSGRPITVSTVRRWVRYGATIHGQPGQRVRLAAVKVGKAIVTTREAFARFVAVQNGAESQASNNEQQAIASRRGGMDVAERMPPHPAGFGGAADDSDCSPLELQQMRRAIQESRSRRVTRSAARLQRLLALFAMLPDYTQVLAHERRERGKQHERQRNTTRTPEPGETHAVATVAAMTNPEAVATG